MVYSLRCSRYVGRIRILTAEHKNPLAEDDSPLAEDKKPLAEDATPLAEDKNPLAEDDPPLAEDATPQAEHKNPQAEGGTPQTFVGWPGGWRGLGEYFNRKDVKTSQRAQRIYFDKLICKIGSVPSGNTIDCLATAKITTS